MDISLAEVGWRVWAGGPVAFLAVLVGTPLVIWWAQRMDWLAYPQSDRWHSEPTALMGGIAIYGAASLGFAVEGVGAVPWAVWAGASVLFVVGLLDDLREVSPIGKLVAQAVATAFLLYAGFAFGGAWPLWISVPLTFLWVIGITNAVNLLDNMDGLAAGIAAMVALVLALFSGFVGSIEGLSLSLVLVGAATGFLVYNFNPARIFMGDCGSLFLGYSIAAVALIIQEPASSISPWAAYLVPLAVLAIPIFDTTLVTFMRKLAGRPVSQGGRDHSSHRLVFLGLSEQRAVLMLYGLSLIMGGVALGLLFVHVQLFYALVVFGVALLLVIGIHLGRANVYEEDSVQMERDEDAIDRTFRAIHALFGRNWKASFGVVADLALVGAAFVFAHYLRFENGLSANQADQLAQALPFVVAVKVVVFHLMGLYRGIWRHAGTPELLRLGRTTLVASLITGGGLVLFFGASTVSGAVLFIDWMVVTLAVGGIRFGFRGLRQYFAAHRHDGARALLYGAGDGGLLALRELRQNPETAWTPVGFIDDDPLKEGQVMQGLRVLGPGDELDALCTRHDVDAVLITTTQMPAAQIAAICRRCDDAGVECRTFRIHFDRTRARPPRSVPLDSGAVRERA